MVITCFRGKLYILLRGEIRTVLYIQLFIYLFILFIFIHLRTTIPVYDAALIFDCNMVHFSLGNVYM